ncbi:dksa/trar family transcriptional regulator [Saccharopolyspora aridisoli]|uniref:Dksa/trar family transcriptional regulator n=1 Tax=Saccharopolyspora aridisoli TaxID=2530385 RepID=A0A4R4U7R5_9PSEU|nr:TraR/DksA C4-type zinc finger protein [Saccharopolyspora aridisoli]TDC87080.1 dksa/trar family transcriptional regulator [Saccharopolyspora aridisoli]
MARKSPERLLADQRTEVQHRIESLQRHLTSIVESATWTSNDDEHDPEGVTIAYERAQTQGLLTDAKADLEALDEAVRRVEDGTYGQCQRCGKRITRERLEALPAAKLCIRCTSARR